MVHVCRTEAERAEAWALLYRVYLAAGYIAPNPTEIHAIDEACGLHAAVILCSIGDVAAGTATAVLDTRAGLPMDHTFAVELAGLRCNGFRMMEVCGVGVRGGEERRGFVTITELLLWTWSFARVHNVSHVICGIPPAKQRLYESAMGFQRLGVEREVMQGCPVALMVCDVERARANRKHHRMIDYFMRCEVGAGEFVGRVG